MEPHASIAGVLLGVAALLAAAKAGGLLAQRWGQPAVLGELVAGIALGNLLAPVYGHGLTLVRTDPILKFLAELGVLILLFEVGLEADLRALLRVGPSALVVAVIGIAAPFVLGWGVTLWLVPAGPPLLGVFLGAALTATSIGITVRVLQDLGRTQSAEGQTIIGAALLDDVLGLVILAVVGGLVSSAGTAGSGVSIAGVVWILAKAALFLGLAVLLGLTLSSPAVRLVGRAHQPGLMLVVGLALCFALSAVAELIGLAAIVGAFAAGLMLDPYGEGVRTREEEATVGELLHPLTALFVPLFFVLMGVQVDLASLARGDVVALGLALTVCAVIGKLACGLGVVGRGIRRLPVGMGMVPRGEVGLIFASIGAGLTLEGEPLLSQGLFSALVAMVTVTTLVAPVGLRWAFGRR